MLKIKSSVLTKKGNLFEVELPAKRIVCPVCEGSGSVLAPGLRGVAFSAEEMDEDPDFREGYFRGDYDVCCDECNGDNVVVVVDLEQLSDKMAERYWRYQDQKSQDDAEAAWERQFCV